MTQAKYFVQDVKRMLGKHKIRIVHIWLSRSFAGIFIYRMEWSLFLMFGSVYRFIRIPLIPIFNIFGAYSNIDIHYNANIKGGLSILHPSVGCVIAGRAEIGRNCTITGGNVIGINKSLFPKKFIIGDNCSLGANATIIGPIILGNNIKIGASACVVRDCEIDNCTLVGIPAKIHTNKNYNKIST